MYTNTAFVFCLLKLLNSKEKAKPYTENLMTSYKTQIKISAYPGLA